MRLLQASALLICACEPSGSSEPCGEDEYKTIDGSCAADEGGGGHDWDSGDTDDWRDTGDWDTGGDVDVDVDDDWPEVSVEWGDAELMVYVTGSEDDWTLGMAELDAESDWTGWTGEDCLEGYTDDEGVFWLFCHPIENDTEVWLEMVETPDEVVEGKSTMMNLSMDEEGHIAYAIWSNATGDCFTWGAQSWYYESFAGCEEL